MYGVVHGNVDLNLRRQSIEELLSMQGFEGMAIGGSLGRDQHDLQHVLEVLLAYP